MSTTQAVQTTKKERTNQELIEGPEFKAAVEKALPRHLTADRFIRIACTSMMRQPKLATCDKVSLFNALLTLSQLGIEPDGRRAHLIPFNNSKRQCVEVQLIIDYKGLAELVMRSGLVSNIHADVVCERDVFVYDRGELKQHTINFREPRGNAYAVYCLVRFKDSTEKCDVMTVDDVEAIRKRSRAGQDGPWVTDWNEMAKKTVFRRMSKWLPLSPEQRDVIEADDELQPAPASAVAAFVIDEERPKTKPNLIDVETTQPKRETKPKEPETKAAVRETQAAKPEPSDNDGDLGPQRSTVQKEQPLADPGDPDLGPEPAYITQAKEAKAKEQTAGESPLPGPHPKVAPVGTPLKYAITDALIAKLNEAAVSITDFEKWVAGRGLAEAFTADPVKASADLLSSPAIFRKLVILYGTAA